MKAFAALLDRLVYCPSRNGKLRLMEEYFAARGDPDRGWALAALAGDLKLRLPMRRIVRDLMEPRIDPVLYRLSRDYVGDTAETVALLWPGDGGGDPPRISDVVLELRGASAASASGLIEHWLDGLDATGRWALLKLVTGALRVGVSSRLAKQAVARWAGVAIGEIEEIWHGIEPPYEALFAWGEGRGPKPDVSGAPVFRPLMLAHPLDDAEVAALDLDAFAAEWKWDGIRVQFVASGADRRLYSRTGDDISHSFPDIVLSGARDVVLDGELLVLRDGVIAPFNDLQQRLNRKTVTKAMLQRHPARLRLYDILLESGDDLRQQTFVERRRRLEAWYGQVAPQCMDLSALVAFEGHAGLQQLRDSARATGMEGLMLKRRDGAYLAGRPKGEWYKLKRAPLTFDTVLMYAQRGSGKRSSYFSDFTFGAWTADDEGAPLLVPVGKAYFGFTDDELLQLDRWVRNNTIDRFGPVRAVAAGLVLEIACDDVHASPRHKSGVAMRFPRIHRIRWDKPAAEADNLEALLGVIRARSTIPASG